LWPAVKEKLVTQINAMNIGSPENFTNFMSAVIDEKSFDKLDSYIQAAKENPNLEIILVGDQDKINNELKKYKYDKKILL
jgi:1-pyrroline-5-carboxylate dehydrogenase